MNKNQHPNAAEALLNWTLTRADGRIVVQHSSGAFYAAAKEGESGIAESILYMLAESLLSATISPAHIGDGVDTSAWPACNPACDPEFNGHKSRHCTCAAAKAALSTLPAAVPAELTNVRCMCGDEYPHDSYGAGFIAGSGMCENCDAAIPAKEPPAAGVTNPSHRALIKNAIGLLRIRRPVAPDVERVASDLELMLAGHNTPSDEPSNEWLNVAALADAPTPPASEQQPHECKCVYATASNTKSVRNGSEMGGYLKAECEACQQRSKSSPGSEQQQAVFAIPDMDEHLLQILGRPNFWCSPIASVLRHGGAEIRRKAEDEQAVVIHWLLTLYLQHGAEWWEVATAEIERVRAAQSTTSSKGGDL